MNSQKPKVKVEPTNFTRLSSTCWLQDSFVKLSIFFVNFLYEVVTPKVAIG